MRERLGKRHGKNNAKRTQFCCHRESFRLPSFGVCEKLTLLIFPALLNFVAYATKFGQYF